MQLELKSKRGRKRSIPAGVFGGKYHLNYNPSGKRPVDSKKALHVVLRSSKARGQRSFKNSQHEGKIVDIVQKHAKKNNIRLYSYSNAGNHLHILLRAKERIDYVRFIRTITGLIARVVNSYQKLKEKFWDGRPFTRIVHFGKRDFEQVKRYLLRNTLETIGWVPYITRSTKLSPQWKKFFRNTVEIEV